MKLSAAFLVGLSRASHVYIPKPCTNTFAAQTTRVIFKKMDSPASTFEEAQEICAKNQGQLAFFKNEAEYNEYLREPITEKEWLGTRRFGYEWLNSDGSAPFLKWYAGEPNNAGGVESCVEIYGSSDGNIYSQRKNDVSCQTRNKFRCRIEKTPPVIFVKMDSPASTFEEAQEICAKHQGQVAFFKTAAEYYEYVREPATDKEWLGIKRSGNRWLNYDGSIPFLKWNAGEPNNRDRSENCVELYASTKRMNDQSCGDRLKFRCRIETVKTPLIVFEKMDSPASTFKEAEEICAKNEGQLAFFKTEAEYNEYLREPVTEKEWLGTRRFGDGWLNSDGSAPFLKWNAGEPNNSGGENCVEIYTTSKRMNDQSCGDQLKFRCKMERCTLSYGAAARTCDESSGYAWTNWLNRDSPGASGDWETLHNFIPQGKVCNNPRAIQAQARSDGSSEKVHFNLNPADRASGFWCINEEQPYGQRCADFHVRFCCHENDW